MTQSRPMRWKTKEETQTELAERLSYLTQLEEEFRALQVTIQAVRESIQVRQEYLSDSESNSSGSSDPMIDSDSATSAALRQHRSPMEMLRSDYKGMKLGDIAAMVLSKKQVPLTTTELCRLIYDTKSSDEFDRARNSLSAELRTGSKGEDCRWKKVGRYAYASLTAGGEAVI